MTLIELLTKEVIKVPVVSTQKKEIIKELIDILYKNNMVSNTEEVYQAVLQRESLCSTGLENGIAVPHAKTKAVTNLTMALGISKQGIDFDALDGKPSHLFFLIIAPPDKSGPHIEALSEIGRITRSETFCKMLISAKDSDEVIKLFTEE
jgi:fructose-specific phosphotransferase system IIA component